MECVQIEVKQLMELLNRVKKTELLMRQNQKKEMRLGLPTQ